LIALDRARARTVMVLVGAAALLAACASSGDDGVALPLEPDPSPSTEAVDILDPCAKPNLTTVEPGALTFATPAGPIPPYFLTDEPSDQLGLESALAYVLAEQLGFRNQEVTWEVVPAEQVLTGEFTDFDIALGGFVARPDEFPIIDYSTPYLVTSVDVVATGDDVRGVLVGGAGSTAVATQEDAPRLTPLDLRWTASVQGLGRPWLASQGWLSDRGLTIWARGGLEMIAAEDGTDVRIIDEPTQEWLTTIAEEEVSIVPGVTPPDAEYSLAMVAGNPLVACVERALGEMSETGQLQELTTTWLDPVMWIEED
jgi:polar amino acid transport system substrate-binding protein